MHNFVSKINIIPLVTNYRFSIWAIGNRFSRRSIPKIAIVVVAIMMITMARIAMDTVNKFLTQQRVGDDT